MKILSIIIPVYNEPKLPNLLNKLYSVKFEYDREIIIIDDGSTDGTREWLITNNKNYDYQLVLMKNNCGKGAAVKEGLDFANGNIMIIQDADLEYEPYEIPKVIEPIIKGISKVSYGSRYLDQKIHRDALSWIKSYGLKNYFIYMGGRIINFLFNILFNSKLTDISTCYKAFDINFLKKFSIKSDGFELEHELTIKIMEYTNIPEIPINYYPRSYNEGKKISIFDGLKIFKTILKYKFVRDYTLSN